MTSFDELPGPQQDLARALQSELRYSEDAIDFVTASRLRAARARAVGLARPTARGWLFASGGLTAAATIVAVLVLGLPRTAAPPLNESGPVAQAEAIEVLTDDVEADFYEDLDLYQWLDRNHDGTA